jgi:hypothetical protein
MVEVVEARSSTAGAAGSQGGGATRRVGPGRIERGYLARIEGLETERRAEDERRRALELSLARARGEIELAGRLERGLQRLLDRQEERLELSAQREKRLALALGAVQRENELLRARLELPAAPPPALPPRLTARTQPRGWWSRLFGRQY